MKRIIVLFIFSLLVVTISTRSLFANPFTKNYLPGDDRHVSLATGGYLFFEISSGDFYLIDTRVGRLWKMDGAAAKPNKFVPVKYEDSKGNHVVQPEENPSIQFPGRYAFGEIASNDNYMLDTVTGTVWKLQGSPAKPLKLTLVPRMDQ